MLVYRFKMSDGLRWLEWRPCAPLQGRVKLKLAFARRCYINVHGLKLGRAKRHIADGAKSLQGQNRIQPSRLGEAPSIL